MPILSIGYARVLIPWVSTAAWSITTSSSLQFRPIVAFGTSVAVSITGSARRQSFLWLVWASEAAAVVTAAST